MEFRDIEGFPGYKVSRDGQVIGKLNRTLKTHINHNGYVSVGLWLNGRNKTRRVHRLVAIAWIDNPQGLPQVNHIDGNKSNPNASNLEWVTASMNAKHGYDIGVHKKCAPRRKLDKYAVNFIKQHERTAWNAANLAKLFDVHVATVRATMRGTYWSELS